MCFVSTEIIILKKNSYRESSFIVSGLSPTYGRLDFYIKGAKRIGAKKFPLVDLFNQISVEFIENDKNLIVPRVWDVQKSNEAVASSTDFFYQCCEAVSFLYKNCHRDIPCEHTYSALTTMLNQDPEKIDILLRRASHVKLVYLYESGLFPDNIFDENVDTDKQQKLFGEIHSLGNTIILVTHEESIARYAHRIIRLLDGEIDKIEVNENPDT